MDEQILRTIAEQKLLAPGDRVLVAVSGGPDSVALLHWLWSHAGQLDIQILCAHFNHGLRGGESDEDERFVGELCTRWGIPFFSRKENLGSRLEKEGGNLHVLARERRYHFLKETARQTGAGKVALAHHQDDQVETIIMRFLRGTGPSGLTGMPYRRELGDGVEVIRPLLDVGKKNILDYLKRGSIAYRIDSSNLKLDYTRNRIRLELMPHLQSYNANLASAVLQLARMLRDDEDCLDHLAVQALEGVIVEKSEHEVKVDLLKWRQMPLSLQRRGIKIICNYLTQSESEVPYHHLAAAMELFQEDSPKKIDFPWGIEVCARYGEGIFREKRIKLNSGKGFYYPVSIPGSIWIPEIRGRFLFSVVSRIDAPEDAHRVYFDLDRLQPPFYLRSRRPGDRLWIKEINGHKKVKDLLIEAKIPREERDQIPLFFAGKELLWVAGIRKSSAGECHGGTRRFLCCRFEREKAHEDQ